MPQQKGEVIKHFARINIYNFFLHPFCEKFSTVTVVFCANTGINKNFVMKQGGPVSDLFYHVENTIAYKEFLQLQCPNLLLIQIRIQDFL
jgi:hypothetical protein